MAIREAGCREGEAPAEPRTVQTHDSAGASPSRFADYLSVIAMTCAIATILVASSFSLAAAKSKFNKMVSVGDKGPAWEALPGVDDRPHSLSDLTKAKVVVLFFTCNRCPTSKVWEVEFIEFARKFADQEVQVVAISVSRNEADSLEKMKQRAAEKEYPFQYLRDESQKVGLAYGATVTPQFFVLDGERRIAYMGAFANDLDPRKAERMFVADAVESLLEGKSPRVKESLQRGCEIEYE